MTPQTAQTVADLTIAEFRALIRETVAEVVEELMGDPDEGLALSDWAAARLEAAREEAAAGELQTVPLTAVARQYWAARVMYSVELSDEANDDLARLDSTAAQLVINRLTWPGRERRSGEPPSIDRTLGWILPATGRRLPDFVHH